MPNISKDLAQRLIAHLRTTMGDDNAPFEMLNELQGRLDQPAITKMTIPPPQAEMADVVYAEGWNAACDAYFGGLPPQKPLIVTINNSAHPVPFTPITAYDVTPTMHQEWSKVFGADDMSAPCPKDGEIMAAAVNAYLGSKK